MIEQIQKIQQRAAKERGYIKYCQHLHKKYENRVKLWSFIGGGIWMLAILLCTSFSINTPIASLIVGLIPFVILLNLFHERFPLSRASEFEKLENVHYFLKTYWMLLNNIANPQDFSKEQIDELIYLGDSLGYSVEHAQSMILPHDPELLALFTNVELKVDSVVTMPYP